MSDQNIKILSWFAVFNGIHITAFLVLSRMWVGDTLFSLCSGFHILCEITIGIQDLTLCLFWICLLSMASSSAFKWEDWGKAVCSFYWMEDVLFQLVWRLGHEWQHNTAKDQNNHCVIASNAWYIWRSCSTGNKKEHTGACGVECSLLHRPACLLWGINDSWVFEGPCCGMNLWCLLTKHNCYFTTRKKFWIFTFKKT